ncbi:ArsR/SmtB family transcription factor [Leptothermofonsia sp. ETS-13]|uniref:ArsR/SmtB family transcription factor n=1 Tax=Leptothermofonsia sp. ETS-13 TaxID=3035696 RepID=UPI003BA17D36
MSQLFTAALAQVAEHFKVLSELSRLQALCALKSGSKNVSEIMEITGLGQANVSKHLKILAQAGIVMRQPRGVSVYYDIADPLIFELCELVCDRLEARLQEQAQQLQQLEGLRQS